MNLPQRVFLNTAVQVAGRVVVLAVGLVTLRLTTTYLGVSRFGALSIVIALTGLATTLGDLGVTTTLAREISKTPEHTDRLGGDLLRFRLATSLGAALLLVAAIPLFPYSHQTKVALAISAVGLAATILGGFPAAFFQANLRQQYAAAVDVLTKVLGLASILAVRGLGLGLYALVALLAASNVVSCVVAFALSRKFWRINLRFDWQRAKPVLRDALGIGLVMTVGLLHFRGDALLLSMLKPARDVGIYAIAYRFVDQAFILPGLFAGTMFPVITRAIHRDPARAEVAVRRSFEVLVLAACAMTLGLFVASRPLVDLIAGKEFAASVAPLRILSFALLFIFVAPVFYNVLIAVNRQRQLVVISVISLALNVGLNLAVIPRYSYMGTASTTLVSEAFSLLLTYLVARRHFAFAIDGLFLLRVGAAAALAAVAAVLLAGSPWLALVAAEAVFLVCAYAVGAVRRSDLRLVLNRGSA